LISEIIHLKEKWEWVGFLITPVIILLKVFLVALCLDIGNFLIDLKLSFKQLFHIAILGETIFIISAFIRIFWLRLLLS
jgi:hypothetical protein